MTEEKETKRATHQGFLEVKNIKIPCFVLEDGTRVISGRGMTSAIGMRGRGQGIWRIPEHGTLKPYINNELNVAIRDPIKFVGVGSRKSNPTPVYEATLLLDICDAILTARDDGALKTEQELRYAKFCDIMVRAFATVGIVALVDEATGYQYIRDRLALQAILEKYVTDEWAKWTKVFPDEFYRELFKLKGLHYPPSEGSRRPSYVGHWTNDIVYSRLAPGVKNALREKNPALPTGHRKRKHHQYLTRDIGNPALREHLTKVIFLMKACTSWSDFKRRLERASSKYGDTIPMDFPEEKD